MVLAPQFWIRVRGMTSRAWATARYGHCSTPVMALDFSVKAWATAISEAPPPGTSWGSRRTLRHTCMASWRLRSTSLGKQMNSIKPKLDHLGTNQQHQKTSRLPSLVNHQRGQTKKGPSKLLQRADAITLEKHINYNSKKARGRRCHSGILGFRPLCLTDLYPTLSHVAVYPRRLHSVVETLYLLAMCLSKVI